MAEPEDPTSIPTEISPAAGIPPSQAPKRLDNITLEALLGAARPGVQRVNSAWQIPSPEEIQADFPQYEIVGVLGRGGMGAVYKGLQKSLDRFVAIKILPPEVQDFDPNFAERFKHEANAMARLSHPAICAVFDAGETPGGLLYFVMEFIEGGDLGQKIATQGRFAPAEAVVVAGTICDALQFAHESGIVHRDIKPSNILLNQRAHWKVADFGLAKLVGQPSDELTLSDTAMGSAGFASPEALTDGASVDHRADIYAVGVILYQMLTGRIPRGAFEMPSQLVPGLDPRFDAIVTKAMQPDRERRYAAARELRADLDGIVAVAASTSGTFTVPSDPLPVLPTTPPRRKVASRMALAAILILLTVGGFVTWNRSREKMGSEPRQMGHLPVAAASKDAPFINSLGMKFVPVPIIGGLSSGQQVLFSVWETRVQDYEIFAGETKREWPKPEFSQGPTHPAVNVTWDDARAFCVWLTEREHKAGLLGAKELYRLPTDHEWSCAIGLGEREDAARTPEEKDRELRDVFPWGSEWPPPPGTGNFSGEEAVGHESWKGQTILKGYRDEFPQTAPVGSFAANRFGLFDVSGNAWEWCEDFFNPARTLRVMRGSSFNNGARGGLFSALRDRHPPDDRKDNYGFRVVLDVTAESPEKVSATGGAVPRSTVGMATQPGTFASATKDQPLVNGLGMPFVPVPITGGPTGSQRVLFCVWETRVQDYRVFTNEANRDWPKPPFAQGPTHPAVGVSWDDAQAFCAWLTERERKAGRIDSAERFRLPTDHEWSCAVGIGDREDAAVEPAAKSFKIPDVFPWGAAWPPPSGAGNYCGEEVTGRETAKDQKILAGYRDDFLATAPVGSFAANRFGIFDLGGNAWEWCENLWKPEQAARVVRGASFTSASRLGLSSSYRDFLAPESHPSSFGFRVVLAASSSTASTASQGGTGPAENLPRWRDALAESPLKEVVAEAEHTAQGYRLPDKNHWSISPRPQRSGAVRLRATSAGERFVSLFVDDEEHRLERVRFTGRTGEWLLSGGTVGSPEDPFASTHETSPLDGQPHEILLARIGGRLLVMLDGRQLFGEADRISMPGTFVLEIFEEAKVSVEKVEYLELDGIAEREALKLIGWDAVGRKPPGSSPSPSDPAEAKPLPTQ